MKPRKENRTFLCAAILLPFFMMSSGLFSISPPRPGSAKNERRRGGISQHLRSSIRLG